MWRDAKKKAKNFAHIKVTLSGARDVAKCLLCDYEAEIEVPGRKRESVVLQTARVHFYKHKLDRKQEAKCTLAEK